MGKLDKEKLAQDNINELGRVPVMMYHGIVNKKVVKPLIPVVMSIKMAITGQLKLLKRIWSFIIKMVIE